MDFPDHQSAIYNQQFVKAGVDGSRTHHGPQRDPSPVLKTGEPTGTQPLPSRLRILRIIPSVKRRTLPFNNCY